MKLDRIEKIFLILFVIVFIFGFIAAMYKQEKISRANIEIETRDYIYYSTKETLKRIPDTLCISFYNISSGYYTDHCGEYTIKHLK